MYPVKISVDCDAVRQWVLFRSNTLYVFSASLMTANVL